MLCKKPQKFIAINRHRNLNQWWYSTPPIISLRTETFTIQDFQVFTFMLVDKSVIKMVKYWRCEQKDSSREQVMWRGWKGSGEQPQTGKSLIKVWKEQYCQTPKLNYFWTRSTQPQNTGNSRQLKTQCSGIKIKDKKAKAELYAGICFVRNLKSTCKPDNIGATVAPSSLPWVRAENSLSAHLKTTSSKGNGWSSEGQSDHLGLLSRSDEGVSEQLRRFKSKCG